MSLKNRLLIKMKRILGQVSFLRNNHRKILKSYLTLKESIVGRPEETKVMDKEWDYLMVLDGCRYDLFEDNNHLEGKLGKINSVGSSTSEWTENNFKKGEYKDTVFIAGNPFLSSIKLKEIVGDNPFYHIEDVWDYGWDEDLNTVHPREINKAARKVMKKHPDKKMIIHYLQPHYPFIGEHKIVHDGFKNLRNVKIKKEESVELEGRNPWDDLAEGLIELDDFMVAYSDNLKLVLKYVEELLPELKGKTIITADHGNCIGEMGLHQHPAGFHIKPLIEVPWFEANEVYYSDR